MLSSAALQQWIREAEAEANLQQEQREHSQVAFNRALRQAKWSIPALAVLAYINLGCTEPAPWTEQEIFRGDGIV